MAEQPPVTPPSLPPKPFKVSKWLAGAFGLFVIAYIVVSLIHLNVLGKSDKSQVQMPTAATSQSELDTFQRMRDEKLQELARKRALMLAEIQKAGLKDEAALLEIVNQLPPCDSGERERLNGQNYVAVNQQTKQVIQFVCGLDDTWHPLPQEAASIEPPTPQQQRAMRRTGSSPREGTSAKDKAAQALDTALGTSSVVDFTLPSAAPATGTKDTAEAKAVPVGDHTAANSDPSDTKPAYAWDTYTGPLYRVFEGDVIEGILTNRLAGEFTGPVNVMVTTNLYSHDHQHILMPQGTRILGEAARVSVSGQRRLAVPFHRAIMPDGYSVDFDRFVGLDQQGATGLTGRVNTHWPKVIATAALVGAIGGLSEIGGFGTSLNGLDEIRLGVGQQTGQAAMQILQRALNVLPTVTVYEGTRVRIWVQRDLQLPAYDNHTVPPTL